MANASAVAYSRHALALVLLPDGFARLPRCYTTDLMLSQLKRPLRLLRLQTSHFRLSHWLRQQLKRLWHSPHLLGDRYILEDNTEIAVYTDQPEHFPGYQHLCSLNASPRQRRVTVSLVVTARNEYATAASLIASLLAQSRLPDEIVVIDTGSDDGTVELLRELATSSPVPFKVLEAPGANIAGGRNQAIAHASGEIVAVTDFGCKPASHWLESLVAPFEIDPAIQVSAGRYQAVDPVGQATPWLLGRTLEQIEPQHFLPSGVSIAFTKDAWQRAGGYPEWLTLTGEDTYFAMELKRTTIYWAFVPEAIVYWEAPQILWDRWRKAYRWSIGDGEVGMTGKAYRWAALKLGTLVVALTGLITLALLATLTNWIALWVLTGLAALAGLSRWWVRLMHRQTTVGGELTLLGTYAAELAGFLSGLSRRGVVDSRRYRALHGVVFILAGVPIDDTGGGARWTQIALELIRRQFLVVFLNKYPKYESIDLGLSIRHPNLITFQVERFHWKKFWQDYSAALAVKPLWALVELPLRDYLPVIEGVRQLKGVVIYDLLDDWSTALGGKWYSPTVERTVVDQSQSLVATSPALAERLEQLSKRSVTLLPNAVNRYVFNPSHFFPRPADWPEAAWHVIYVGSLWGTWFDWALLVQVAQAYPEAGIVVIGDYAGQCKVPPPNLHFLGLKPQYSLPAYLAHADVAIIPWQVNDITQSTSPLKVYEYLAMHKPVVAPDIQPLRGLPGVHLARDANQFVALVGHLRQVEPPVDEMDAFIQQNDWSARVEALLSMVNG